jgi:hypothetical protein
MKTYNVLVHENTTYRVAVEATSADEAELKAEDVIITADPVQRDAMCVAVYERQTEVKGQFMNKRATDARSMLQGDVSEEAIIDAITDLIHLCSHLNLDWERVTAQAEYHFDQEAAEGEEV